jgi:hypothetical protein
VAKVKKTPKPRGRRAAESDEEIRPAEDTQDEGTPPREERNYARSPRGERAEQERLDYQAEMERRGAAKAAADLAEQEELTKRSPNGEARETRPLTRYLLLSGSHQEGGVTYVYERGREVIVNSPYKLDALFMNKFRNLDGETNPGRDFRDTWDRPGLADPPLAETRPNGFKTQFSIDSPAAEELANLRRENAKLKAQLGLDDEDEDEEPAAATTEVADEENDD